MEPAKSTAAMARQRRAATKGFLDSNAWVLRKLKDQCAGKTASTPTISQVRATLAKVHPSEFQYETFSYLGLRSPQSELWHGDIVRWGRDVVSQHETRQRKASGKIARRALSTANFLAAGGDGRSGGVRCGGPRGAPAAEPRESTTRLRVLRKTAARAVSRGGQAHAKSARAWEEALAAGNPGVSRGLWLKTARDFRRALRLGCCKVSPPRKTKAMKAKKGGEKEAKAKKVMKAMK